MKNFEGIPCIIHQIKLGDNVYDLGWFYNVRPATINLVNNLENISSLKGLKEIYIPLSETNYFTSLGISEENENYLPLFYTPNANESFDDISNQFFVSITKLKKWNIDNDGQKVKIGYVKISKNRQQIPLFVVSEKKYFVEQIKNAETEKLENTIAKKSEINEEKSKELASTLKRKNIKVEKSIVETQVVKSKIENPVIVEKTENSTKKNTTKVIPKENVNTIEKERKIEKESFVNSLFKNSNSYKKEKESLAKRKNFPIVKAENSKPIKKKVEEIKPTENEIVPVVKEIVKNESKIIEPTENNEIITKDNEAQTAEDKNKVVVVENTLQKLSLNNSSKGKGAYFFSGNIGGRFYVFTNLVPKGSIVKVMNNKNKKYILAEVMNSLPNKDMQNGYLIKISENAKYPLGQEKGNLDVSIFY
ncbi:MAG: hypothetical protein KA275_03965 [Chitinophagaceae bacterium]|nr:hypothetical protein [Chitinophagaceae bacterium]